MCRRAVFACFSFLILLLACIPASATRVIGEVTRVGGELVTAEFPVPVYPQSMVMVLAGSGEAIAGTAVVQTCAGDEPPYLVTSKLLFATDSVSLTAGKKCYVASVNTGVAPSISRSHITRGSHGPSTGSLGLYYFAAGQTIGYGALGLGYERRQKLFYGASLEVDGGVTGVGNVTAKDPSLVRADQLIKSLNGRFRLDFGPRLGFYAGYRWMEGRGDTDRWQTLTQRLRGAQFAASSDADEGTVETRGIEYGLALRPSGRFEFLGGYIPCYRADFGSLGVQDAPAYSGELRIGFGPRVARLRGIVTDNYWTADLGISIR